MKRIWRTAWDLWRNYLRGASSPRPRGKMPRGVALWGVLWALVVPWVLTVGIAQAAFGLAASLPDPRALWEVILALLIFVAVLPLAAVFGGHFAMMSFYWFPSPMRRRIFGADVWLKEVPRS